MTTSTSQLLFDLNARREAAGLKPLKTWKASRSALEDAIAKLPPAGPSGVEQEFTPAQGDKPQREATRMDYEAANDEVIQEVSPVDHPPVAADVKRAKPQKAPKDTSGTRTIPELARALGKKEKVARAKCRRWGSKLRPLMVDTGAWRFKNEHTVQVCTILGWDVPDAWKEG